MHEWINQWMREMKALPYSTVLVNVEGMMRTDSPFGNHDRGGWFTDIVYHLQTLKLLCGGLMRNGILASSYNTSLLKTELITNGKRENLKWRQFIKVVFWYDPLRMQHHSMYSRKNAWPKLWGNIRWMKVASHLTEGRPALLKSVKDMKEKEWENLTEGVWKEMTTE